MTRSSATRPWLRPMLARVAGEEHRAATPLELFFDLCFVVAVALAAGRLHHDIAEGHAGHGVLSYLPVFFAIWWAWMNFTWFASAYDTDDNVYRLTTLVQIAGALVLAAGVPRAFDEADYTIVTYGYVLMRLAMVAQWLRAARSDPPRRRTDLRYALGVGVVQVGWLLRLLLPDSWFTAGFLLLVLAELAVPVWAERPNPTTWHPRHIAERYGLFTLIVLGETVLAVTVAIQAAGADGGANSALFWLAGAALVIVFSMWWLYFDRPAHDLLTSLRRAVFWGYGHYFVFASGAAVGAGLSVAADQVTHHAHVSARGAAFAVAVPVAVFLVSVWVLHILRRDRELSTVAYPVAAVLVLLAPLGPAPVQVIALLLAALVAVGVLSAPATTGRRHRPG